MFVQTHIQRSHRQNLTSNSIKSNSKLYQHQRQNQPRSLHLASVRDSKRERSTSRTEQVKPVLYRKITRDASFDTPNDMLDYSLNYNSNTNKPRYSEKNQTSLQSYDRASHSSNTSNSLLKLDDNSSNEFDKNLILASDNLFGLEKRHSKFFDSLPELLEPSLFPPNISNESLQVASPPINCEFEELCESGQHGEEIFIELSGGKKLEPIDSLCVDLGSERDAMIADQQDSGGDDANDNYQYTQVENEVSYDQVNDGMKDYDEYNDIEGSPINQKRISEIEKEEDLSLTSQQTSTRSSIISCSRKNFAIALLFCRNFITYQLETWRLLADSTTSLKPSSLTAPNGEINSQQSMCSICHMVQTNSPESPPHRMVFRSKVELNQAEHQDYQNDLLPELATSSVSCRSDEQVKMEPNPGIKVLKGSNYMQFPGPLPALNEVRTIKTQEIEQNFNKILTANNLRFLETTGHRFGLMNGPMPGYQHETYPQKMEIPSRCTEHQNYQTIHQASINEQDLFRGSISSRQQPLNQHHLYRASTGIELGNWKSRGQFGSSQYQRQQHHQTQPQIQHHDHHHPHHHQHRNMIYNYRAQTAEFAPSLHESFDLSLDEKYPPPVASNWYQRNNNTRLNQPPAIDEAESSSIKRNASQSEQDVGKMHEYVPSRNKSVIIKKSIQKQDTSVEKKKNLLHENQLNTGSDSQLCTVKREQVSQQTGVVRRPSTSKPPSIEKINQPDSKQISKMNYYLSTKEDSMSISPSSVDSSKLLTIGFNRLSKRISPSKLSLAGARRRLWLKQKGLNSLSVQRSEEIAPVDARHLVRQMTTNSLTDSGTESGSWISRSQIVCDPRACFVEGLGQGQIASRQALVSPYLGDIQLSLSDQRGMLEVEVVRARRLHAKPGARVLPSPFVKVYLMKDKKCIAKFKTNARQYTLDPLFQEKFIFRYDYENCVLQVIVWGDYGRKDRKCLMGISQIQLGELEISNLVIDWYQLFNAPSMASSFVSSKALRQTILMKEESR